LPVALLGQAAVVCPRDPARALMIAAAVSALRARKGHPFPPFFQERADRVRREAEQAVGPDAARLWDQGGALDVDAAIALAFGAGGTSRPRRPDAAAHAHAQGLTARQAEVARLVAEGRTNREIAARLTLSVRTVESHVRSALVALGLANRTQLATWARDRLG
jgi:DNA-binding NarL/FixJ family response regulator